MAQRDLSVPHKFPRLCPDISKVSTSEACQKLLVSADIQSENDALSLLLHVLMMEIGFQPQNVDTTKYLNTLPENWREVGIHYKFVYNHPTCPSITCVVIFIPIGQSLMAHGILQLEKETLGCTACTPFAVDVNRNINKVINISGVEYEFQNLADLNQSFKDSVALKLLVAAQHAAGVEPTFGFLYLMPELKLEILHRLPTRALLNMAEVNQEFYELANTPSLWENLFLQHFPSAPVPEMKKGVAWKKMYKEAYLEQQEQRRRNRQFRESHARHFVPRHLFPDLRRDVPPLPPGFADGRFDPLLDPRPRMPPNALGTLARPTFFEPIHRFSPDFPVLRF